MNRNIPEEGEKKDKKDKKDTKRSGNKRNI